MMTTSARRRLGSGGPELSRVGLGGADAGGDWASVSRPDETVRAMHAAFAEGVNWVDTAEAYGDGRSEEIIGRVVAGRPDVLVATKFAPARRVDRRDLRRSCEASLARLGREAIDIYQLHFPTLNLEETWEEMGRLVDDGLVRWIGVSNFDRPRLELCERIRHVDLAQLQHSVSHRSAHAEIAFCHERGIGVVTYGTLAYGLLTLRMDEATSFASDDWRSGACAGPLRLLYDITFAPTARAQHLAVARAIAPVAAELGISVAELAIAWAVAQPGVTSAIVGTSSERHAADNARAGRIELAPTTLAEIERRLAPLVPRG